MPSHVTSQVAALAVVPACDGFQGLRRWERVPAAAHVVTVAGVFWEAWMGGLVVLLLAAVVAGGWCVSLFLFPFTRCGGCGGSGLRPGSDSRRFGWCRRCGGSKRRLRAGARWVHRSGAAGMSGRRRAAEKRGKQRGEL